MTRSGVPVGELVPVRSRRTVNGHDLAHSFRNEPHIDFQPFREDIDRYVNQDTDPRG